MSVDCAEQAGGRLSTIENPRLPGVFHNPHSFYHRAITSMPWYVNISEALDLPSRRLAGKASLADRVKIKE